MGKVHELLSQGFEVADSSRKDINETFAKVESSLEAYLERAKNVLMQKNIINPKPLKRLMRTIQDEGEEEESSVARTSSTEIHSDHESLKELRPVRTAKTRATSNLKEIPLNAKMRNDNNLVMIKTERTSSLNGSIQRESLKENQLPVGDKQKRRSPDEGIQSARESEVISERHSKRSNSVELISSKLVEIDITGDDLSKMPPPPNPKKATKKLRPKPKPVAEVEILPELGALRVTRSKIKKEKISAPAPELLAVPFMESLPVTASVREFESKPKSKDTTITKKAKKYPMPILIKIERESVPKESAVKPESPAVSECNATFNVVPAVNETVTIAPAINETVTITQEANSNPNATVTLSSNPHDSLMTEDNDDDGNESMEDVPPPPLPKKNPKPEPASAAKPNKNEMFNPYMSSPVKQRVQAFEKHAALGVNGTPTKFNTMPAKYNTLKNGTPSKIALYSKTTPLNKKLITSSTGTLLTSSAPGHKVPKPLKKMHSLSQESLEDGRKQANAITNLLEEKRKAREEKQKQAQILREAIEKEKREQALKIQLERDEKYRKIMKEKEENLRMEALKKKIAKEKQAKKYAEEKAKTNFLVPKPVDPPSSSKNDSLHLKMQKQLILDKSLQKKKEESKNNYDFDMLHTDDSTDDESRPSAKRPSPPEWSKKKTRKPLIVMQSLVNHNVLDSLFSVQPISVDLRAIFPSIDARKLVRNSSAIWRTPPKQQHHF